MNITGGKFNGRIIKAPDSTVTRPTLSKVRMSIFNTLYSLLGEFNGLSFLDLFAGSGIMGLEAASRGFSSITAVEKNRKVFCVVKSNYDSLNFDADLICEDSLKLLNRLQDRYYDVIYIDPPYLSGIYEDVLAKLPAFHIVIVEHSEPVDFSNFDVLQSKNYGGKLITYLNQKAA